ncbi:hypothetical protein [Natrialba taiwanensis]|uniref:Restriction endonuclease domain-containing protein n=1 Tax=Natrialba taiwanensis DSM 12281 TaxID=1230458 RepID=L9ZYP6_9EURY|nr:hypothetical protein [Natrialba taiwanensis]ELY91439.1 hypothetical protein C484_10441 [Natrialba taiwanensis DSM 12281]
MSKRTKTIYRQYQRLNHQGWEIDGVENCVKFNGGSETTAHRVAKTVAASVCIDVGYRVRSEVECPSGDADILAFGLEDRRPIVVELENDLSEDVAERKREQYNVGDVSEVWIIDLDNAPVMPDELYTHIAYETGLSV